MCLLLVHARGMDAADGGSLAPGPSLPRSWSVTTFSRTRYKHPWGSWRQVPVPHCATLGPFLAWRKSLLLSVLWFKYPWTDLFGQPSLSEKLSPAMPQTYLRKRCLGRGPAGHKARSGRTAESNLELIAPYIQRVLKVRPHLVSSGPAQVT
jgi:hypothetical protein